MVNAKSRGWTWIPKTVSLGSRTSQTHALLVTFSYKTFFSMVNAKQRQDLDTDIRSL